MAATSRRHARVRLRDRCASTVSPVTCTRTNVPFSLSASQSASHFYAPAMSAAERMRTKVRFCVEALDLAYLYGEAPTVQARESALPRLEEDPELFAGAGDEVVVEEVDR